MASASEELWILGIHMTKFGKHPDRDMIDLAAAEHDLLLWLHLIETLPHQLGNQRRRSVTLERADARVAVRVGADRVVELTRTGEHNAEIRSQDGVG